MTSIISITLLALFAVLFFSDAIAFSTSTHLNPYGIRTIRKTIPLAAQYKGFDDMLANIELPVLVDFYAEWCGPCKMMQPVLETVASRMDTVAKVAKVDTEKSPKLAARYNIEALPTLILFAKGEVVDRYTGYRSADDLEKEVRASLKRYNGGTV